ncbi:FxsA family protein [Xinfangfangia sp. CPCC 101601]|uniref:FxsA family protein n=1 Tax=Pseudogemmobacter lacusdianii TaxID=3069608 RepID=A0ABU0VTY1_9RHOB|nr:FxsA family protein [Xinfangfangia sp. CPCC 101601]MDQ2065186.1 FxsA family protein [Xinfangfangia sp. CPCC 101601]
MKIFTAFLLWPLAEIALFVLIGGEIGLWATLIWVVLSGVLGVSVLRMSALPMRETMQGLRAPAEGATRGLFMGMAGVLLILPGFLTDAIGLLLLLPPVQALFAQHVLSRLKVYTPPQPGAWPYGEAQPGGSSDIIDAEYTEVPPKDQKPSGWTRID